MTSIPSFVAVPAYTLAMGKTLVVTNSLTGGGAERSMNSLVNLLHTNSVEVLLFPINEGLSDAVLPGCEVITPVRAWKAGLIPTLISFFKFREKVKEINPDLVIVNCELPELYSVFLPLRIKLIFVEHTSKPWQNHQFLGLFIRTFARFRNTDWVLVSDHLKRNSFFHKSVCVIPNLVSTQQNQLAEGKSPEPRIVFLGRLSAEKDPKLFLEIAELSNLPALVIGTGVLFESLVSQSKKNYDRVSFLGQLNNPWAQLHSNDIIILTSRFEGDGLVLLEAISRNLPVLVRDISDLRRFGLPEVNYFQSAEIAANRLIELNSNSGELRIPTTIAGRILSTRDERVILTSWAQLIKKFTNP
jgi:glycosyltransferase involved in cell wall biosynthesis